MLELLGRRLFPKRHVCVQQAAEHADIYPDTVEPRKHVVTADEHAQIGDANVFQTADDRGRQCRIELRAQDRTVRQDEAHDATEQELCNEQRVIPMWEVVALVQVAEHPGGKQRGQDHEKRIVIHKAVFTHVDAIQLLLDEHTVEGGQHVGNHNECVALWEIRCVGYAFVKF